MMSTITKLNDAIDDEDYTELHIVGPDDKEHKDFATIYDSIHMNLPEPPSITFHGLGKGETGMGVFVTDEGFYLSKETTPKESDKIVGSSLG